MNKINLFLKANTIILFVLLLTTSSKAQNFEDKTLDAASVTPVTLISIDAARSKNDIVVTWKTATEINNSHFIIERSTNGIDFTSVGQVLGTGNSNIIMNYSFNDAKAPSVKLYYRLQQVDFNGRFEYSPIVLVTVGKDLQSLFTIYPNPVENRKAIINTGNAAIGKYFISVKSIDGKSVFYKNENVIANNQILADNCICSI